MLNQKNTSMKTIFTTIAIFITTLVLGQSVDVNENSDKNYKLEDVSLSITVNNKEDLEQIEFDKLESLFENLGEDEPVSFEIVCNSENKNINNNASAKFRISSNSSNKDQFFKRLYKIKKSAIKFYNSNN